MFLRPFVCVRPCDNATLPREREIQRERERENRQTSRRQTEICVFALLPCVFVCLGVVCCFSFLVVIAFLYLVLGVSVFVFACWAVVSSHLRLLYLHIWFFLSPCPCICPGILVCGWLAECSLGSVFFRLPCGTRRAFCFAYWPIRPLLQCHCNNSRISITTIIVI